MGKIRESKPHCCSPLLKLFPVQYILFILGLLDISLKYPCTQWP